MSPSEMFYYMLYVVVRSKLITQALQIYISNSISAQQRAQRTRQANQDPGPDHRFSKIISVVLNNYLVDSFFLMQT